MIVDIPQEQFGVIARISIKIKSIRLHVTKIKYFIINIFNFKIIIHMILYNQNPSIINLKLLIVSKLEVVFFFFLFSFFPFKKRM